MKYYGEDNQVRGLFGSEGETYYITILVNNGAWADNYAYVNYSPESLSNGTWYQVGIVLDLGTLVNSLVYIDGAVQSSTTGTAGTPPTVYPTLGSNFRISGNSSHNFDGILDEFRISNTTRTAAWLKGTYNSLYDTLLTYCSEETEAIKTNVMFMFSNF